MQWEDSNSPSGSVKNLERIKKGREAQLKKLLDESKKDNVLIFEKLGVDYLFVDEADAYAFGRRTVPNGHRRKRKR